MLTTKTIPDGNITAAAVTHIINSMKSVGSVTSGEMDDVLTAFNLTVGRALSSVCANPEKPYVLRLRVSALSVESKECLKNVLESNNWVVTLQDRDFFVIQPMSAVDALEETKRLLNIYMGKECPYCSVKTVLTHNLDYPDDPTMFVMQCPKCLATVQCHAHTTESMGVVATDDIRRLRVTVHEKIDDIWKTCDISRDDLYYQISKIMHIPKELAHVSRMWTKTQLTCCVNAALRVKKRLQQPEV